MVNSKEILVVFLTAENCGHCQNTRGEGILNAKNKFLTGSNFIKKLIKDDIELINIHYHNMMATKNSVKNISKFYNKDKLIYQEKYENFQDFLKLEVYKETKDGSQKVFNDFVKDKNEKVDWKKFINDRIPTKVLNYVFFFPCFLVLKRKNWYNCIQNIKEELIALTNAGFTHKDKFGNIGLEKTQQSIYGRTVDIVKLIEDVIDDKVEIKVNKEEKIEEIKEEKIEEKKKNVMPIAEFIDYKDVVIKSYDD